MKVLIIEDEFSLADVISDRLKKEKFIVDIDTDGEEGCYDALNGVYDLIILDVMLPNMNGFEILKKIRDEAINSKVIMLTAKSMIEDKLEGFKYGADDYITKPFHIEELVARCIKEVRGNVNSDYIEAGDIKLNIRTSTLLCTTTNESIDLVCKEFLLLEYFINNKNQIISKEQLYDKVWGLDNDSISNNLEAYISFIRKKLKLIGSSIQIKSVRGLGYKLEE